MTGTKLIMQARTHYGDRFDEIIAHYMLNGYVYIGPELVVLAQEHSKSQLMQESKKLDKLDAWYIQYVAGDMKRLFEIIPDRKEWVVFERWGNRERKAYKLDKLQRRICHGLTRTT